MSNAQALPDLEREISGALMQHCHCPAIFARFASRIVIIRIMAVAGGDSLYIPQLDNSLRDREIKNSFTGNNYQQLAQHYDISERQIRRIIKNT